MKAIVTKENFKKALSLVGSIVSQSSTLPILNTILLQTEKGRLKISATNLEIGITVWLGGKVEKEGKITLPARTVNEYVVNTPGDQINLEAEKNNLTISTPVSSANIKTLPPEEFPLIPQIESTGKFIIEAQMLKNILTETTFAAAPQETQPELSGIYVSFADDKFYLVATDRYRLIERSIDLKEIKKEGSFKSVLIPHRTCLEVVRIIGLLADKTAKVEVGYGENQITFKMPDIELVSRLIDADFPDYKQIVPKGFTSEATLPRQELLQAVKSAGLFAATTRSVKIIFESQKGCVLVSAASGDIGESTTKVEGVVSGQEQGNTFNYKYLLDYLNNISDPEVIFKIINDNSPALLCPKDRQDNIYVVMPIKA